jgi:hypothetical protein
MQKIIFPKGWSIGARGCGYEKQYSITLALHHPLIQRCPEIPLLDRKALALYKNTMRRSLAAPLLSALMPGVGQILNRQFPKAGLMIFGFSLLFLGLFFKLLYDLNQVLLSLNWELLEKDPHRFQTVTHALAGRSKTLLIILILLLLAFWVFGVWDAYVQGRKLDREREGVNRCGNM